MGLENKIWHGADYNPDQWLQSPEILKEDIRLMKKAGMSEASVGIFAWAALEPEEGVYTFDWLENVIQSLYDNGIYTMLATPSGARPAWMAQKYPEILRVGADMTRNLMGGRHNHCMTSPIYRQKVWEINRRLSERFGGHPGVILWHLSNEYSGECFCPLCQNAFRDWLKAKYATLERLNHAWWTAFWSHTYTDWSQIEAPVPKGETMVHGLVLDWKRFVTDQTVDFCKWEKDAVRAGGSGLPVTTNLMGFFNGINYFKFKDVLDIVSWDSYPQWNSPGKTNLRLAAETACTHALMRGIKNKPFLLMESSPSAVNWSSVSKIKKPGLHMLEAMQAIAHGANSVQYFQWRKSRGSSEKFHGAVVDHYGKEDTRVFKEVSALGKRLEAITENLGNVQSQVATIYDWENRWAIEQSQGPRNQGMYYLETVFDCYEAFWKQSIPVDLQDMECDFSKYKLVVAPMLYMYRDGIAQKLRDFVRQGGILAGTYWSGIADENDLCFLGGAPGEGMSEVFGLRMEEIDALWDCEQNETRYNGTTYKLSHLCERVIPGTAQTLAAYEKDYYAGQPVLLKNCFDAGEAYYLAARANADFYLDFFSGLCREKGIHPCVKADLPAGVSASARGGEAGQKIFIQNFNPHDAAVRLHTPCVDIETGLERAGSAELKAYETIIVRDC